MKTKCTVCNGDGFTSEHNPGSFDDNGYHDCCGCPIQVECYECNATGYIELPDFEAEKLNDNFNDNL